jgi:hypothetical protein
MDKLLKSLIKVGLAAATPVWGDIIGTAMSEGVELLFGARSERQAKDIEGSILKKIKQHAHNELYFAPERLSYILPNTEVILKKYALRQDEWASVNYNPTSAAQTIIKRAQSLLRTLDTDEDRRICGKLIEAFYVALFEHQEVLRQSEAQFRGAVLGKLDSLPDVLAKLDQQVLAAAISAAAAALIDIPGRPWNPELSPPGALLRADIDDAVPFHGREQEMVDLDQWCESSASVGIRLYTGAGGMGKTRLAIEMCKRYRQKGWRAGFLSTQATQAENRIWASVIHHHAPLLVVVDYAETRHDDVSTLLREVFEANTNHPKIRLMLLARAADDWWECIKTEGEGVGELLSGPATRRISLQALAMAVDDRKFSYQCAATHFASMLQKPTPQTLPDDIGAEYFERVLLLHMDALAAVEGVKVRGDQGILDFVLNRERRFWRRLSEERQLPRAIADGIGQAMATVTLGGGATTQDEAVTILKQIPLLKEENTALLKELSDLLHDVYPGKKWIEPVLPDLLGEHLVQEEMKFGSQETDVIFNLIFGQANDRHNSGL